MADDEFDGALKSFVAKRFSIALDTIESVTIEHNAGSGGCPSCGYGGECDLEFRVLTTTSLPRHERIEIPYDFGALIREIVECGAVGGQYQEEAE